MIMQNWRKRTDGGKTEVLGEKPVVVPLFLAQIVCTSSEKRGLGEKTVTERLNLGTACSIGN